MKQWINLYLMVPKAYAIRLPAKMMVALSILFFAFLFGFSMYNIWQNQALRGRFRQIESQRRAINAKVIQLTRKYAKESEISVLAKKVSQLQREVQVKSHVLSVLKHPASLGFSKYLNILSDDIVPEVWLTRIEIGNGGERMTLSGNAYKLEAITQFMQKLEAEDFLMDKEFKLAKVNRTEGESGTDTEGRQEILGFTINIYEGN